MYFHLFFFFISPRPPSRARRENSSSPSPTAAMGVAGSGMSHEGRPTPRSPRFPARATKSDIFLEAQVTRTSKGDRALLHGGTGPGIGRPADAGQGRVRQRRGSRSAATRLFTCSAATASRLAAAPPTPHYAPVQQSPISFRGPRNSEPRTMSYVASTGSSNCVARRRGAGRALVRVEGPGLEFARGAAWAEGGWGAGESQGALRGSTRGRAARTAAA